MFKETVLRLKKRWKIESNKDFSLIMLVYSLAGLGVGFLRRVIFALFGLTTAPVGIKIVSSLLLIVPLYQLSTLAFSLPLGQFSFFWGRQKAYGRFIARLWNKTPRE